MISKETLSYFSQLACKALLNEVSLTPKPGLVDCSNNGAHDDMTIMTFLESSLALMPHFNRYIEIGYQFYQDNPKDLFEKLRQEGILAEEAMFTATNGVNTHKGVNFSFALILGATGSYLAQHPHIDKHYHFTSRDSHAICQLIIPMTKHLIAQDLSHLEEKKQLTNGEKLYLKYGIKGPRGEASQGYPSLTQKALPYLRELSEIETDKRILQLRLLLYLMSFVEDANLIHRGGIEALYQVQSEIKSYLQKESSTDALMTFLTDYNQILINRHLSPGGAADLLALSLYFAFLEKLL
ncbi:triphosphoribosyl-dephospho-CoA synthase CitG [Streptococcus uberis]|uniref:triphosphoribosyl-dephospho-CoA synthase CitG n=1 Tax=Streptococcus uberis TaxID=1349 RepID=UPI000DA28FAC|nr:triphosphoribosyl-dephospho-CoA synthase CitG [Streptococcus uberis]MCK1158116.1 triphosphoribosyl-dephospho-CoA synthase CitG [Streptococcus uberis]MCK1165416.1 triphosphoribosyl-dephospho-CoA synthase CitG [Streptococcus uberis]MCK1194733.1 triphosphoribosyl-dephospho-CoA synthase CitG [Streptococcus uberis]MCK1214238.1 triphosphoribosyl-dephospho-CoA synthase CitG [Streptococcus uberis]MCK1222554.1 triphosphoribosyl-dephospho-CoA synthase CitG [Streptococcus uberis]